MKRLQEQDEEDASDGSGESDGDDDRPEFRGMDRTTIARIKA